MLLATFLPKIVEQDFRIRISWFCPICTTMTVLPSSAHLIGDRISLLARIMRSQIYCRLLMVGAWELFCHFRINPDIKSLYDRLHPFWLVIWKSGQIVLLMMLIHTGGWSGVAVHDVGWRRVEYQSVEDSTLELWLTVHGTRRIISTNRWCVLDFGQLV